MCKFLGPIPPLVSKVWGSKCVWSYEVFCAHGASGACIQMHCVQKQHTRTMSHKITCAGQQKQGTRTIHEIGIYLWSGKHFGSPNVFVNIVYFCPGQHPQIAHAANFTILHPHFFPSHHSCMCPVHDINIAPTGHLQKLSLCENDRGSNSSVSSSDESL